MAGHTDIRFSPVDLRWDFVVVARYGETEKHKGVGNTATITVHQGVASRDLEVQVIESLGRTAEVHDLRGLDKWARTALVEMLDAS